MNKLADNIKTKGNFGKGSDGKNQNKKFRNIYASVCRMGNIFPNVWFQELVIDNKFGLSTDNVEVLKLLTEATEI